MIGTIGGMIPIHPHLIMKQKRKRNNETRKDYKDKKKLKPKELHVKAL